MGDGLEGCICKEIVLVSICSGKQHRLGIEVKCKCTKKPITPLQVTIHSVKWRLRDRRFWLVCANAEEQSTTGACIGKVGSSSWKCCKHVSGALGKSKETWEVLLHCCTHTNLIGACNMKLLTLKIRQKCAWAKGPGCCTRGCWFDRFAKNYLSTFT